MLILFRVALAIVFLVLLIALVIVLVVRRERRDDKHPYEMDEIDLYRRSRRWPD